MPKRTSIGRAYRGNARHRYPNRVHRLSDAVVYLLDECRAMMKAVQRHGTANDVCADALMRTSKSLRRKLKQRGLDPAEVIRAAGVKRARSTEKFRGVPDTVRPRVERESR